MRSVARFWRRSRAWPPLGRLAFVLLLVLVGITMSAVIAKALHDGGKTVSSTLTVGTGPTSSATSGPTRASTETHSTSEATSTSTTSTTTSTPPTIAGSTTTAPRSPSPALVALRIATQTHASSYDRAANFGGWLDQSGCRDTRAVLLIRTSRAPVTFTSPSCCTVKSGRWTDPWSEVTTTVAHAFQIDHTVPLFNAWVSGAWSWTHAQRVAYANDLRDFGHLVPIAASENEAKGASGPDEWRPPSRASWCLYALVWDRIKAKWHLSATPSEWKALAAMAAAC